VLADPGKGVAVDDELDLLPEQPERPEQQDPTSPRRPMGLLVGALVAVALLAVAGVFWMVTAVSHRSSTVTVAGASSLAPATTTPTAAPATTAAAETVPPPTATFSLPAVPVGSAGTVLAPPPRPTPKPAPRPVPKPTLSTPVGKLVPVPGVIGLRVARASTELRAAGFKVQVIGGVLDPDRDDRRVVAQRPTPGSVVLAGSTVILVTDGT
jgi:hypothetical protein